MSIRASVWAIIVARRLRSLEVLETLAELFVTHGVPEHLRSDNGPEFTAALVRHWLAALNVETLFIEPGSPWENGYVESSNGKLRDELLDREIFYTLTEAKILIERWRREYNTVRPHSALGYRPPAQEAISPAPLSSMMMTPARQSSAYLSRRTLSHARVQDTLEAHLELLRCYYNFVRPHGALKFGRETRTPAMQAGLATRQLTLRDIFVSLQRVVLWLSDVRVFADLRRTAAAAVMYMPVAA